MEIRFAKAEDVPGIIKLLKQAGKIHHAGRPDLFRNNAQKYGPSQVLEKLGKVDSPIFVAVEEGRVLGCGFCKLEIYCQHTLINDSTTLHIDDLCIPEQSGDMQIGTAIYNEILRYAKYRGCYNVTVNVWSCNESAIKFYESLGLKPRMVGMEAIL